MTADRFHWSLSFGRLSVVMTAVLAATVSLHAADPTEAFLKTHCLECHQGDAPEGKLDLERLSRDITNREIERRWVRIHDRLSSGEMPPKDAAQPASGDKAAFLEVLQGKLVTFREVDDRENGRVRGRRLTRRQIATTLQDLLAIDARLDGLLTEDAPSDSYSTVADRQTISHFHLEDHLRAVDRGLDEAFHRVLRGDSQLLRELTAEQIVRRDPRRRTREPEMRDGLAVIWSSGLIFYGRIPATTAPEEGWYHFKLRAKGLKLPQTGGVWTTVQSGLCVSSAPLLNSVTTFEATEEMRDIEFDAYMAKGEMLEIRPGDVTLKRARFQGGQVGVGEGEPQEVPGVAMESLSMERVYSPPADVTKEALFGDLEVRPRAGADAIVVSKSPEKDAETLLSAFAERAFRRPVSKDELEPYLDLVRQALNDDESFAGAMRMGYRAILCSPRFLYFFEAPGPLDDYAFAARLSYFLTGTAPDRELRQLAAEGRLKEKDVLRGQIDRLLEGRGVSMFVADFCDEWLDLQTIGFTEPDPKLYPGFDSIVQSAMLNETWITIETMILENRSVSELIKADHTYLNSRLARFYGIEGVEGDEMRKVTVERGSHRGGIITNGSVLKVTSNGSSTSPIIRGIWVAERLLGIPIPPPPENIPAIEPDIRGSKSIRELLAKHRSQDSCATCHVKIDPPGFALENFDPSGRWRERYLRLADGRRERGAHVEVAYTLPDGREFESLEEFQTLVGADARVLAVNLADELLTYGTGAAVSFADRAVVEAIANQAAESGYGFRSVLYGVIESPTFQSK
ncbi:hypothetical protein Pan44_08250 [Caulifigura coniformis]|uniref:Planctomycete cytochrome C n=2 Tax=Caulifigura coniformis TaxID=2527983 RepID=A0A517S9M7_9PLAN|nr:hypothetical protein Pan44_08250 [Caulifigura coniformis]